MFDATYFRNGLPAHITAAGADPSVEIHLLNGQAHRIRSVVEVADGYVVLEAYQRRPEMTGARSHWQGSAAPAAAPNEIHRAVVTYENVAQIVITPAEDKSSTRIGFNSPH